ncbi:MAG: hypothetical protein AUK48_10650 [Oscillatoriales cyanobacterium CG2_30_44_21]|nr:MAG: hypothetical protein AUK48_10650 [Oscillatoriales cyanobacterium CG2_30_44_21]
MRLLSWTTKFVILAIAGLSIGNIAEAQAQSGNVVVYIAGKNPVTLSIARQVVTNPIIALVNGRTSIVTGSFDPPTANYVTRELQRRGVAAQQAYQSFGSGTQTFQPSTYSPTVTLPNYLPNTASSINNQTQYRYVTAIPVRAGVTATLNQVRRSVPNAFVAKSARGDYIYVGGYTNRESAESLRYYLRSQGLEARVLYF